MLGGGCVHARPDSVGFFFQAEDGIRDLVRSRGLGDVYKRQVGDPDDGGAAGRFDQSGDDEGFRAGAVGAAAQNLSLIHI